MWRNIIKNHIHIKSCSQWPKVLPVDGVNHDTLDVPIGEIVGDVRLVHGSFRAVLIGVELHFSIAFRPRRVR